MDAFKKVDLAVDALKNAAEKTVFGPVVPDEALARFNKMLEDVRRPPLPLDFMYLLHAFGPCTGPYVEIYGLEKLIEAQGPPDIWALAYALEVDEDDEEPKLLWLGRLPPQPPPGMGYDLAYKDGAYYHVEDDRGVLTYFRGADNIGDFILNEIKTAKAARSRKEVEKWSD